MGQWVRTLLPIIEVINNGGSIDHDELANRLTKLDSRRFPSPAILDYAMKNLIFCLRFEGSKVVFDKNSDNYARMSLFERSIQEALHARVSNMVDWQLYPFVHRSNSEKCPMGIPWGEILPAPWKLDDGCDYSHKTECCELGCRVDQGVFRKYAFGGELDVSSDDDLPF